MTNIDMGDVEYHSAFSGFKNISNTDFKLAIPSQSIGAGSSVEIFRDTDIEVNNQIVDVQFSLIGLNNIRYQLTNGEVQIIYDSNYSEIYDDVLDAPFNIIIRQLYVKKKVRFFLTLANTTGSTLVTPAFDMTGTVTILEPPFIIAD